MGYSHILNLNIESSRVDQAQSVKLTTRFYDRTESPGCHMAHLRSTGQCYVNGLRSQGLFAIDQLILLLFLFFSSCKSILDMHNAEIRCVKQH